MIEALYYTTHSSAIGELLIVASARGVRLIRMLDKAEDASTLLAAKFNEPPTPALYEVDGFFTRSLAAIDDYLLTGTELQLPVDFTGGTPLQRAVWLAISKIPYGKTISYSELAERVGFPRAIRAVASACGANPVPLAIACHRVVGKDGGLGGFSLGGTHIKEKLLALENPVRDVAAVA